MIDCKQAFLCIFGIYRSNKDSLWDLDMNMTTSFVNQDLPKIDSQARNTVLTRNTTNIKPRRKQNTQNFSSLGFTMSRFQRDAQRVRDKLTRYGGSDYSTPNNKTSLNMYFKL